MKLETEKALLNGPTDDATSRRIKEFELIQLGPFLGYDGGGEMLVREIEPSHSDTEISLIGTEEQPETMLRSLTPSLKEWEQDAHFLDFDGFVEPEPHRIGEPVLDVPAPSGVDGECQMLFDAPYMPSRLTSDVESLPVSNCNTFLENIFVSKFDETSQNMLLHEKLLSSYQSSFDKGKWLAEIVSTTGSIMNKIIQLSTKIYNTNGNPNMETRNDKDLNVQQQQSQTLRLEDVLRIEADPLGLRDPANLAITHDTHQYNHGVEDLASGRRKSRLLGDVVTKRLHTEAGVVNRREMADEEEEKEFDGDYEWKDDTN
ncbi:hypothetical protein TWF718_010028 [Orbilia javanica]|uniref:Uncharacterized protein n=1 Tax=Orbilia javanica TaxID=47235 RepID=A0AAN8MTD7_9PEZI